MKRDRLTYRILHRLVAARLQQGEQPAFGRYGHDIKLPRLTFKSFKKTKRRHRPPSSVIECTDEVLAGS